MLPFTQMNSMRSLFFFNNGAPADLELPEGWNNHSWTHLEAGGVLAGTWIVAFMHQVASKAPPCLTTHKGM
jgi:hypothetical protein